ARARGVTLYRDAAAAFAPAARRRSTSSRLSRWAAQWSALEPSTSGALTSTRAAISDRTAFTSAFLTASMSRRSPGAAPNEAAAAAANHIVTSHLLKFFMGSLAG